MSFTQKLTVAFLSLVLPATVVAAAPANVKSVQASVVNGQLVVSWAEVPGSSLYRVYYSHESILENAGNYDDFVATTGPVTTYTFSSLPLSGPSIYVGVLAVDAAGTESEGFEVEASTMIVIASSSSSSVTSSVASPVASSQSQSSVGSMPGGENPTSTAEPMAIASVTIVSSTGVLVSFTKTISSNAAINPSLFLVTTSTGILLPVLKAEVQGKDILLTTMALDEKTGYILSLLSVIPAEDGTNATPNEPQVRFGAEGSGMASSSSSYGRNPQLPVQEVPLPQNPPFLDLSAVKRRDGTYDVLAQWGHGPNADSYSLYTSKDNAAYVMNAMVNKEKTSAQYTQVEPGMFGFKVASKNTSGESSGIEKTINLPATGIGFFGIAAVAGAVAGRRMKRRKIMVRLRD